MSKRTERQYLGDMLDYARKALALVRGKTREQYDADEDLQHALSYRLMVIGEAAYNVSEATRSQIPEIAWPRVIAMRHRLVHDYGNVDRRIVWDIATERLPDLIAALEKIIPPEPPSA